MGTSGCKATIVRSLATRIVALPVRLSDRSIKSLRRLNKALEV